MDGQPVPIPRLRLTRNGSHSQLEASDTPGAGPSRLSPTVRAQGLDDSQADATPRIRPAQINGLEALPADTPAARLRAIISRGNAQMSPKTPAPSHRNNPTTPSEVESDFEPPDVTAATPSMARFKDIFSKALREPGDTPQKSRKRRNSIDVSEVESSPRVQRERASNKGKRKSLSDEEAEHERSASKMCILHCSGLITSPGSSQHSEISFRSSQAATFDLLRDRLTNPHIAMTYSNAIASKTPTECRGLGLTHIHRFRKRLLLRRPAR